MSNTKFGAQTQLERQQKQQKGQQKTEQQRTYVLHLRQPKDKPRVSWTQDTIDNENMNKKKSNLCCIYHRPGQESSDTCTSDDQGNALQRDRHTKHLHKKKCSKLNKKSNHNQKHEQNRQQNDKNLKFDS